MPNTNELTQVLCFRFKFRITQRLFSTKASYHDSTSEDNLINRWQYTGCLSPREDIKWLKSFCLRDWGRFGNEGWPISLKIGTLSGLADLCNMPKFQVQRPFLAEVRIPASQGSPAVDFQSNFGRFSISLLATYN